MRLIDLNATRPYVLRRERDLPKETQTVFHLRALPDRVMRELKDNGANYQVEFEKGDTDARSSRIHIAQGEIVYRSVRYGVARIENVEQPDGTRTDVEAESTGRKDYGDHIKALPARIAAAIPWGDKEELSEVIMRGSDLSEDDRGNSPSRRGLPADSGETTSA